MNAAVDSVRGALELSVSIYWRNICSKHWLVLRSQDTKLELRLLSRFFGVKVLLTFVMDKLKAIENAISENDLKRIDKLKDCLKKTTSGSKVERQIFDLISLISQLPQDELAHALSSQ